MPVRPTEPDSTPSDRRLKSLATASAWVLLALVIILLISGWGITQTGVIYKLSFGLVDRKLANSIHRASNIPLAFFFLTHVMINLKFALFRRFRIKGWWLNSVLVLISAAVMYIVIYLEYFRLGG